MRMVTLRCTANLRRRLRAPQPAPAASGVLGDWYAKLMVTRPRHLVLCVNECSLLCVVVPLAPATRLLDRFAAAATRRIEQISASAAARQREVDAFATVHLGPTASRSVVSSLNHFGFAVTAWLEREPNGDVEELGLWLCDTPCTTLVAEWPWREAERLLAEADAPEGRA